MVGSMHAGIRARCVSEDTPVDVAQCLAGAPEVKEPHGRGQGGRDGEEGEFGGDGDATGSEESDEPGELRARTGGHGGAVLPGGV